MCIQCSQDIAVANVQQSSVQLESQTTGPYALYSETGDKNKDQEVNVYTTTYVNSVPNIFNSAYTY